MTRHPTKSASALLCCGLAFACSDSVEEVAVAPGPSMSAGSEPLLEPTNSDGVTADGNSAPVIRSLRFEPASPTAGEALRVIADTFDLDGDAVGLSYVWSIQGKEVRGDSVEMTFLQSKKRDSIEVTVTPTDGRLEGQPMSVETLVSNRPPTIISLQMEPSTRIQAGTPIIARPQAHDLDGDPVLFEFRWTVNGINQPVKGSTLITAGLKRGDLVRVEVVANDGDEESAPIRSEDLEIRNSPPKIVSMPSSPDATGSFVYQLEIEDADDRRFVYKLSRSPEGMEIDLVSGRIDWTPASDQLGSFPVEIVVDDRNGGRSRQSFELEIASQQGAVSSQESPAALPN